LQEDGLGSVLYASGGIITPPGLPDAPPGPLKRVLAALSGPALAAGLPTRREEALRARDGEIRALLEAALRLLDTSHPRE